MMKVTFKTQHATIEADICGHSEAAAMAVRELNLASEKSVHAMKNPW